MLRDGAAVVESSEKFSTKLEDDSHVLVIKEANIDDVGEYTCQAENVTSKTELEVQSKEEKIEIEETQYIREQVGVKGQDITFNLPFK